MGIGVSLFATLLLIPLYAAVMPSGEASAAGGDAAPASFPGNTSAAPVWIVKMSDDDPMYRPSSIQINAGQTVEWENDGQVSHSVTDDPTRANQPSDALLPAGVTPFNSGNVMPGGRFRHTFSKPGRYRYFCLTHEGDKMIGEILVIPSVPLPQEQLARSDPLVLPAKNKPVSPLRIVKMHDDEPMYVPSSIQIVSG